MFRLGAHVSISDGFQQSVETEHNLGGNCGQIFVGSPRGWKVKEITEKETEEFNEASNEYGVEPWIVHGTYLINFATPKEDLGEKSLNTVQQELDASSDLGIPYYVFHPGSHTGAGVDQGIKNIAERISELTIPDNVTLLLENTTGKGTSLGQTFDHLNRMVEESTYTYGELGVCLDTCHLYAGGYDFTSEETIDEMLDELDSTIGMDNVHYLHLNDSKHPFDSEKDEHEHIGEGAIGDEGFELFVNHDALRDKPMVLETPVDDKGYEWNINKIKDLRHD